MKALRPASFLVLLCSLTLVLPATSTFAQSLQQQREEAAKVAQENNVSPEEAEAIAETLAKAFGPNQDSAALMSTAEGLAKSNPDQAAAIAAAACVFAPELAPQIAALIAAAAPNAASSIVAAVSKVVPSQATAVSAAVAAVLATSRDGGGYGGYGGVNLPSGGGGGGSSGGGGVYNN